MSKIDLTASVKAKIGRSAEHVRDLNWEVEVFNRSNPYEVIPYEDLETGYRTLTVHVAKMPPPRLLLILGDAIHNLRSALDHLMQQLVIANARTPHQQTSFVIYKDIARFQNARSQRIHDIGTAANDLLEPLCPYYGGNKALWTLDQLDIIDKHRLLITTGMSNVALSILGGPIPLECFYPDSRSAIRTLPAGGPVKDGTVLFRIHRSQKTPIYVDPEFKFQVAFGEVCEGEPLVGVLQKTLQVVFGILTIFEPLLG
jgi:hypothetical protein